MWTATTDRIQSPPAVGLGKVWVAGRTGLYLLNASTGRVEAELPIKGFAVELAIGGGFLWGVSLRSGKAGESYELFKVDPLATRVVKHANLAGRLARSPSGVARSGWAARPQRSASSESTRGRWPGDCS